MQDGPVFRNIDLVTSKHGIDLAAQTAFFRQLKEEFERFVGDTIFRVIEVEAHGFRGQALAALRVIGKELSKMKFPDLLIVRFESLPSWPSGK